MTNRKVTSLKHTPLTRCVGGPVTRCSQRLQISPRCLHAANATKQCMTSGWHGRTVAPPPGELDETYAPVRSTTCKHDVIHKTGSAYHIALLVTVVRRGPSRGYRQHVPTIWWNLKCVFFYSCDPMLARYLLSSRVRPYVRLSVCLTQAAIVSKRLNIRPQNNAARQPREI